jgi:hypothetical protein
MSSASVIGAALEAPRDGVVWVLVNPQERRPRLRTRACAGPDPSAASARNWVTTHGHQATLYVAPDDDPLAGR